MNIQKIVTLIVVSVLVAILLASALNSFTRVADEALAEIAPPATPRGKVLASATPSQKWLPIIFLNAPNDLYWSIYGNGATNPNTNFIGAND